MAEPDLAAVYRELKEGRGHEHVTDANVDELIALARGDGNALLQTELAEWRSPGRPHRADLPAA